MKIKIALCNNDPMALSVIAGATEALFRDRGIQASVDRFQSCEDMLAMLVRNRYQLVFVDIDMAGMDGIEAAKVLRENDAGVRIVFVISCENRVFDALAVHPLGFVRKTSFLEDMTSVIGLVADDLRRRGGSSQISLNTRNSKVDLESRKISYIEGNRNYQLVYVVGNSEPTEVKMTLDRLEELMEPFGFIRIHKGYLVNYRHINRITYERVTLDNGTSLPVGRSKATEIKARFLELSKA